MAFDLKTVWSDAIKDVINAKVDGKEIVMAAEEVKPVVDIMSALKDSIEQAKEEKKPMKKAAGDKAATAKKKAPKKKAAPKKAKAKKVA